MNVLEALQEIAFKKSKLRVNIDDDRKKFEVIHNYCCCVWIKLIKFYLHLFDVIEL